MSALAVKENTDSLMNPVNKKAIADHICGGFYTIGSGDDAQKVPDSKLVQFMSNNAKISVEITHKEQTNEYATVTARAISPCGGFYVESTVYHHFETVMNKKIVEMYKKELEIYIGWEMIPSSLNNV